jgi:protein-S-isoprenylcysteine O-methyltransferase Ste14
MPDSPNTPSDSKQLQSLQRRRKQAFALGLALWIVLLLFTESRWRVSAPGFYTLIWALGLALILVCIVGRTWCTLYIGGLKKRQLVTLGPYSVTRNPLYAFTLIGAAGIGAQTGSLLTALLAGGFALAIFTLVVRREENFLDATFGDDFAGYAARVPRFLPDFTQWQEADELLVRPRLVRQTFLDACVFLLAAPLTGLMDWAREVAGLPILQLF